VGLAGALFSAVLAACAEAQPPGPLPLVIGGDTVLLAVGARILDVRVQRRVDGVEFDPAVVAARPGDVLRFTAGDTQGHAIAFDGARLGAGVRDFLERTGQLRGPPLPDPGTSWIVSLDGAPPGIYPFRCLTHGVGGVLRVEPP
jgi:plastocyanin